MFQLLRKVPFVVAFWAMGLGLSVLFLILFTESAGQDLARWRQDREAAFVLRQLQLMPLFTVLVAAGWIGWLRRSDLARKEWLTLRNAALVLLFALPVILAWRRIAGGLGFEDFQGSAVAAVYQHAERVSLSPLYLAAHVFVLGVSLLWVFTSKPDSTNRVDRVSIFAMSLGSLMRLLLDYLGMW